MIDNQKYPGSSVLFGKRNSSTRIDVFNELSTTSEAALRQFFRRIDAPHYVDEVLLPTMKLGDTEVYTAVRDRPWPPWGLGARTITAMCEVHSVAPESWAISPVYLLSEEANNIGLICALYKEVLEALAVSKTSEVCYLAAEGSVLVDHCLTSNGFSRDDDVFLTEQARYFTYRTNAKDLLKTLGLDDLAIPDLLSHDFKPEVLERNAMFHHGILLGALPDLKLDNLIPEVIGLGRGGHASKPAGVPGGTGTAAGLDQFGDILGDLPYVSLSNFLNENIDDLMKPVLDRQDKFQQATVLSTANDSPEVNEQMRRAFTLDDVEFIEQKFIEQLKGALPGACSRMGIEGFPVGRIELQITASKDGSYYRMHRDADAESTRELSFVYFFHTEPRQFYGGELRLYDNRRVRGVAHADSSQLLSPRQDMLVIFPSDAPHELLPVRVPSGQFSDSRFTINGWIHRVDEKG